MNIFWCVALSHEFGMNRWSLHQLRCELIAKSHGFSVMITKYTHKVHIEHMWSITFQSSLYLWTGNYGK